MAEIKKRIGTVACPVCGTMNPASVNDKGTLNYACNNNCDNPGWARVGTKCHELMMAKVIPFEPLKKIVPTPEKPISFTPEKPITTTPAKKAGFFS